MVMFKPNSRVVFQRIQVPKSVHLWAHLLQVSRPSSLQEVWWAHGVQTMDGAFVCQFLPAIFECPGFWGLHFYLSFGCFWKLFAVTELCVLFLSQKRQIVMSWGKVDGSSISDNLEATVHPAVQYCLPVSHAGWRPPPVPVLTLRCLETCVASPINRTVIMMVFLAFWCYPQTCRLWHSPLCHQAAFSQTTRSLSRSKEVPTIDLRSTVRRLAA